jgi:hypothetical protein
MQLLHFWIRIELEYSWVFLTSRALLDTRKQCLPLRSEEFAHLLFGFRAGEYRFGCVHLPVLQSLKIKAHEEMFDDSCKLRGCQFALEKQYSPLLNADETNKKLREALQMNRATRRLNAEFPLVKVGV